MFVRYFTVVSTVACKENRYFSLSHKKFSFGDLIYEHSFLFFCLSLSTDRDFINRDRDF